MLLTINPTKIYSQQESIQKYAKTFSANTPPKTQEKEKNNLPAILLTVGAITLGVLACHKLKKINTVVDKLDSKNLEEFQIQLKNIFSKDFSKKDTFNIINRYKQLNEIKDNREFYNKLFEQLKKDFKVENKNLTLELWDKPLPVDGGEMRGYTEALTRKIGVTALEDRIKTSKYLFHEFKHVKQNELMYKTDPQKLINIKVKELEDSNNASWKEILKSTNGNIAKARKLVEEEVKNVYKEFWGHLEQVSKTSESYKQGLKYLENEGNRIPPGEHYYEQILEKEAQFVENAAEKLLNLIFG